MTGWPGQKDLLGQADSLAARLPAALTPLARVAFNYRWSWTPGGREVFRAIDPYRWEMCGENPVRLLTEMPPASLDRAAEDAELVRRAASLAERIDEELARPSRERWPDPDRPIAFFCAEFGIHRSLPIYAGGLGVLAGDILKEASDGGLPMVGVGLMYRQGSLHQRLDPSGWQHEYWFDSHPERLPAALVSGDDGSPVTISVAIEGRAVVGQVWRLDVGRIPLYLLDAERPENSPVDRWITSRIYVGERRIRLAQYVFLGIGGIRALRAMGIEPGILHLNEGHAALAPFELAALTGAREGSLEEALATVRSRTVFTTHTPVPAGNETCSAGELLEVLGPYVAEFGAREEEVVGMGRSRPEDPSERFGLTPLGLRMSRSANAVSRLHGRTAREMWQHLYPDRRVEDVPIGHVTNAVHLPTWMAPAMRSLLDRHLGQGWTERAADPATWSPVEAIPDEELWAIRRELRSELVEFVRERSVLDRLARGEDTRYAESAAGAFDPDVLTLGFARRVAAYKRLYLLVHDRDRAVGLMSGPAPFQLVIAGKAHPQDEEAKRILQGLFALKWEPTVAQRVAFLEDYDLGMAERLVWGCDVWVNLPRVPLEASGTSGMKSALNGGLNVSTLDGWWEEAYDGTNGWGIEATGDPDLGAQDGHDAGLLYDLLEREVLPLFQERDREGIPRRWVSRIKASLRSIGPRFCATRMLDDYARSVYGPS